MSAITSEGVEPAPINPRTQRLLQDPILPMLIRLAWPNILIMLAQASTGLIETWWVSHMGTEALAGMALVFPAVMLMQMMSAGGFGGAISSSIARALGGGRKADADLIAWHAVAVNVAIGLLFSAVMLFFGRPIYQALGGQGGELEAALVYSNVVFGGMIFVWLMNGLASVVRGTGNMLFPALVTCFGAALLVPVSPLLIFGVGPVPGLGIAGGGLALVFYSLGSTLVLAWYILSGRNLVRFGFGPLRWSIFSNIVRLGAAAAINSILTNVTIGIATALVATKAGVEAVAGFGTGARLEYLLIPVIFGIGAPMVALVGTNMGAGQKERAIRIAFTGAAIAFVITEAIGLIAAVFPVAWISLFSEEHGAIDAGVAYLQIVGPVYGFFGAGLALYFACQGAGQLFWPLACGFLRLAIAGLGGWLALKVTGSLNGLFFALAGGLLVYGTLLILVIHSGVWFRGKAA
ncbi:MATE family efflux transporter [Rhizobium terrae]|uniref:MATE family efflux transporter n=1 Tax=Rhizobium terrae TaxID=2171756 RepID=UPI000E3E0EDC|nr:MATE family efflux transporter [Rhizobium terrae]